MATYTPQQRAYIVRLAEQYPKHDLFVGFNGPRIPNQASTEPTTVIVFGLKSMNDPNINSWCIAIDPEGRNAKTELDVKKL